MRLRPLLAVGCVLALVVPACSGRDRSPERPIERVPAPTPTDPAPGDPTSEPPGEQPPADGADRSAPVAETPKTATGEPPPPSAAADDGPVGHNARAYLQGSVPRLVVEVNAVGERGSGGAVEHLSGKLAQVVDKPGGIEVRRGQIPGTKERYSLEDVRALERVHRRTSTGGDVASLHIMFLNGHYEDRDVLGLVYSASSYAIFADRIREVSTPLVPAQRIERSVVLHEAGHLLGLLNIGFSSPRDREDPDNRHHSRNRNSVMYWAVETSLVISVLQGPPPDDFDADDRADLADLRAGRL